ncbi:MAG: Bax inhibitor-1/YccA family protein [Gammaproteobacteria bacterium]
MFESNQTVVRHSESVLATNSVLRNTYLLLSLTLLFSAATAGLAFVTNASSPGFIVTILGVYGLMFLTQALRNSVWGIVSIFAFTGFLGYTLGPLVNAIVGNYSNGSEIVMTALGATGVIFLSLSAYTLTTRKDFSYLGGFLFVAAITAFLAMLGGVLFNVPMLHVIVSAAFVLISSGMILYQTSLIIQGGERNYIMATIALFVALYNLFVSLLHLLTMFAGNRD